MVPNERPAMILQKPGDNRRLNKDTKNEKPKATPQQTTKNIIERNTREKTNTTSKRVPNATEYLKIKHQNPCTPWIARIQVSKPWIHEHKTVCKEGRYHGEEKTLYHVRGILSVLN